MQFRATPRDSGIDGQHAAGKRRQNVAIQPSAENAALLCVYKDP